MALNKVILIGYVGRDPEVRYFDSGNAIASFTFATSERGYKLANGTEVPERTEWHNIVARRDLVPFVEKWVKKGSGLLIEGKLRYRNYEDQQGIKRYVTEIFADKVEFFTFGRNTDSSSTSTQQSPAQTQQAQSTAVETEKIIPTYSSTPEDDSDASGDSDDLPF